MKKIEHLEIVGSSFQAFAKQEIHYRKPSNRKSEITPNMVLQDTIDTCLILAKRGNGTTDEKLKFTELQKGIRAFGSGFLMIGNFRIDDAIPAAARIACLPAKILFNDLSPIKYYEGQDMKELNIEEPECNFLSRLKRQPNKSGFYYWYMTVQLIISNKDE